MSGYLQRLLDRGAGLAAAAGSAPAEVAPAMATGSPVLAFDQRLAEPGWAQGFGLPHGPAALDLAPEPVAWGDPAAPGAQRPALPVPAGPVSLAPATIPGPQPEASASRRSPDGFMPLRRSATPEGHGEPVMTAPVSPGEATALFDAMPARPAVPHAPAVVEPTPAALAATVPAQPQARAPMAREDTGEQRRHATVPGLAHPAPPRARATPAMPVLRQERPRPLHAEAPRGREAWPSTPDPSIARARPATLLEPQRRAPEPLAPLPAAGPDPREVQRLVREAVRAELAGRPAAPTQAAPAGPQERPRGPAGAAPATARPASAHEASVIGALEPSASPLTLYGLRRR